MIKRIKKLLTNQAGNLMTSVLVFGAMTTIAIGGIVSLTSQEVGFSQRDHSHQQALAIAEAGIQYYRWHLAHAPEDFQDGTGGPGPYVHDYKDPLGDTIGQFSLEITPPEEGSSIVTIESTGSTADFPGIQRRITAQFGIPSLAQYSFLHNANVWFGGGLTVNGRAQSNGGIRQDGVNNSVISSSLATYTCGSETGCSPPQIRPGVWGSGGPSNLWDFPVNAVDFDAVNVDFASMRTAAQNNGIYYDTSSRRGYRLIFDADGTVDIYEVRRTRNYQGYDSDTGCTNLAQRIRNQTFLGNFNVNDNPVMFFEDTIWVEGTVNGNTSVVAARFPLTSYNEDIWINDSIQYLARDGNHSLGLLSQDDIIYIRNLPDNFVIDGALLAQGGKVFRHYYGAWWCGGSTSHAVKNNLNLYGSLISAEKSYWNWGSGPSSGFTTRDVTYDSNLFLQPPPYFPSDGEYEFIFWEEDTL